MQVLLINQNATIERLVKLSSGKLGYELASAKDILEVENGVYDFIIIDSDLYNDDEFGALKEKFENAKYLLIITKGVERPAGFDVYIEKPFLPTELVDILGSLSSGVAQDDSSIFEDSGLGSELGELDEDAVFGSAEESDKNESIEDLGGFDELSLDDDNTLSDDILTEEKSEDFGDLELSLDGDDDLSIEDTKPAAQEPEDEMQINLDEQIGAIADEVNEIDFDSGEDDLGGLDGMDSLELDTPSDEPEMAEEETNGIEDGFGEELELDGLEGFDNEEHQDSDPQIFDEDEVNKLKNLLDETEEDKLENEDFDLDNIKIQNDELGSLTEESLAEALGVNIDTQPATIDDMGDDLTSMEDETLPDTLPDAAPSIPSLSTSASTNIPANAIQLNPNQSITISLDALKELLNMADVTINITLSKKQ
ncbi:MAG: hypothetical protein AB7D29_00415 [Campylobacterales bacterium]